MSGFTMMSERVVRMAKRNNLEAFEGAGFVLILRPDTTGKLTVSTADRPCRIRVSRNDGPVQTLDWVTLEQWCRRLGGIS